MEDQTTIVELAADYQIWNNELNDIKENISELELSLTEYKPIKSNIDTEHFQNQFIVHKNAIENVKNHIQKHELSIQNKEEETYKTINEQAAEYHQNIKEMVDTEIGLYQQLKAEFLLFI